MPALICSGCGTALNQPGAVLLIPTGSCSSFCKNDICPTCHEQFDKHKQAIFFMGAYAKTAVYLYPPSSEGTLELWHIGANFASDALSLLQNNQPIIQT